MVNLVVLQGRLYKESELKHSGVANRDYCNNTLIINMGKDKEGKDRQPIFVNFTVWGQKAEYLSKYSKKGGQVIIEGRLGQKKDFNYEKNMNEYELQVVPPNITIIDYKEKQMTSALTGELPNQGVTSIKSNEVLSEEDYNQIGFDVDDDDLYPF